MTLFLRPVGGHTFSLPGPSHPTEHFDRRVYPSFVEENYFNSISTLRFYNSMIIAAVTSSEPWSGKDAKRIIWWHHHRVQTSVVMSWKHFMMMSSCADIKTFLDLETKHNSQNNRNWIRVGRFSLDQFLYPAALPAALSLLMLYGGLHHGLAA